MSEAPADVEEAPAAPEGVQEAVELPATATASPKAAVAAVAARGESYKVQAVPDIENSGVVIAAEQVSSDARTPLVILFVALVVAGTIATVVMLVLRRKLTS